MRSRIKITVGAGTGVTKCTAFAGFSCTNTAVNILAFRGGEDVPTGREKDNGRNRGIKKKGGKNNG